MTHEVRMLAHCTIETISVTKAVLKLKMSHWYNKSLCFMILMSVVECFLFSFFFFQC